MENSELRHLQLVILGVMKEIDRLCVKNNIDYYLIGGSAIGAIRHKGFIPWDDDLDIIMDNDNYSRFLEVCKKELDTEKYALQEGLKDWPMCFSKVRLKGTRLKESVLYTADQDFFGIYVDIFKMDNVPDSNFAAMWQYFCAKTYLCYQLLRRGGLSGFSRKKRIMIHLSSALNIKFLRGFFIRQVEKYNSRDTGRWGFFYGRTSYKTAIVNKTVMGKPIRVPFEDVELPVAERYDDYLSQMFGDYMTPPPLEKQVSLHLKGVDFGQY